MSSQQRRAERQREFDAECEARRQEEYRKAKLSVWERIEESDASADVKEILHIFAQHLKLEL